MTPISSPEASTTGAPLIPRSTSRRATSLSDMPGATMQTSLVMTSRTLIPPMALPLPVPEQEAEEVQRTEHADRRVLVVDHHDAMNVPAHHQFGRSFGACPGVDGDRRCGHQVADAHPRPVGMDHGAGSRHHQVREADHANGGAILDD